MDATASATPMPVPPVATVTSTETPSPPADPPPVFVPPSVTDPVSNLDFPPVDDAFALEMRAESIEQLAGGDALRRGESERIEAGRSQTNADLVAGRDRVRVHGTIHEHTGHGRAEQAAHLHTTVDGTLDVHAASEDTVLLAGHMSDLWDGRAAIVAAMTDDTVGGGGIRVTTPLDLWVHGLMGVEERIGTCTADAVLLELGATHYEREYGPGVHAAGLAAYTGSLYQSNRSTFRALMRMSCGVRNLIAGSDGGGGGGAPVASPPPAPAQTGAAEESAIATLAAGRRAVEAPATALDTADALTDARQVPLEELVNSVDARATEEMGEAGIVMRAGDLPELTRCADTAERLGALQETLRMDATESAGEATGGFRASEIECAVSMHPTGSGSGPLEIGPPSAACGENASMVRSHAGVAWGQAPEMKLGLLGGADRPPRPAAPESDFPAVRSRLCALRSRYSRLSNPAIINDLTRATTRVSQRVMRQFKKFGGNTVELAKRSTCISASEKAYLALQEMARQAERDANPARAARIRGALSVIDDDAIKELRHVTGKHGIAEAPATRAMQQPPAMTRPTATDAAIPPPARASIPFDWITAYRRLCDRTRCYSDMGRSLAHADFHLAVRYVTQSVMYRFGKFGGKLEDLPPSSSGVTMPEQAYRAIQDMVRLAEESGNAARARQIRQALEAINQFATRVLGNLKTKHGALDALPSQTTEIMQAMHGTPAIRTTQATQATQAMQAMQQPPVTIASTTAALAGRLGIPGPAHRNVPAVNPAFSEPAGGLVHTTDVPGPPPASGFPGPSLCETAGAESGGPGRSGLDPPATVSAPTAAHPAGTEAIVTPSLAGTSSFWLQPADPVPVPGSVPFGPGLHAASETAQPPPVTTAPSSTAPDPSPGAAYPGRFDAEWLDQMRELPGWRGEPAAPGAALTTVLPEVEVTEIDRFLGTGEGVPHAAPLPPPSAAGRTGAGAGAPPPAADPWRIRPPGMGGEPHPVAFDPWSAPPGPSSRVVYTEAIRTPVPSTGAPPGWPGAETPGFARAASGAVELPFSHREAIALRFSTEDALLDAELTVQLGGADALDWSATRWRTVLDDLSRLNAIAQVDPTGAAAVADVDWPALEALGRILDDPPPSP